MAKYTLERNDGTVYELEGPEGASKEDLVRVLGQKMRPQQLSGGVGPTQSLRELYASRDAAFEPREFRRTLPGQVGELFRGIPRGAVGLLKTAGVGASALLPERAEEAVRGGIERVAEAASTPFQPKAGYEDALLSKLGEGLGSTGPFLAAGLLRSLLLRGATGLGLGTAAGAGEARIRAEEAGATDEERARATALGTIPGALEVLPPTLLLGRFRKAVGPDNATTIVDRLRRVATSAGEEGLQEAASNIAQNLIAQGVYDPEQGTFTDTGESFGLGAGVGGLISALVELGIRGRGRGPRSPAPALAPTEQESALPETFTAPVFTEAGEQSGEASFTLRGNVVEETAMGDDGQMVTLPVYDGPRAQEFFEQVKAMADEGVVAEEVERMFYEFNALDPVDISEAPLSGAFVSDGRQMESGQVVTPTTAPRMPDLTTPEEQQRLAEPITVEDVEQTGVKYPAKKWLNDNVIGKTRRQLQRLVQQDPALLTAPGTRAQLLESLLTPPTQPTRPTEQLGVSTARSIADTEIPGSVTVTPDQEVELPDLQPSAQVDQDAQRGAPAPLVGATTQDPLSLDDIEGSEVLSFTGALPDLQPSPRAGFDADPAVDPAVDPETQAEPITEPAFRSEGEKRSVVPSYYMDEWKQETGIPEADVEAYGQLGADQRDAPERLMVAAQKELGGGVLTHAIEHVGDLTNRMSPQHSLGFAYESTIEKAENILRSLRSKYGFRREHEGNLQSGAEFKGIPLAQHKESSHKALDAYADAHANLETYVPIQTLARDAAVALGRREFEQAETLLSQLLERIPTREAFVKELNSVEGGSTAADPSIMQVVQPKQESDATSELNQSFARDLEQSKTTQELLGRVANNKLVPYPLRNLARQFRSAAPNVNVPVEMVEMEGASLVGEYVPPERGRERIMLDPRAKSVPQTFLHEFVHPITYDAIRRKTAAGRRVIALYEQFKKQYPDVKNPETGDMDPAFYGLTDAYEFVAEGITSPTFQTVLKRRNLWERFVDAIRSAIGLPVSQNKIIDELLDLTKEMAIGANAKAIAERNARMDVVTDVLTNPTPDNNQRFLRVQGDVVKEQSVNPTSEKFKRALSDGYTNTTRAGKELTLWALHMNSLNDLVKQNKLASADFKNAMDAYSDIMHAGEGSRDSFVQSAAVTIDKQKAFQDKATPAQQKAFENLVYDGNGARVDLRYPESRYKNNPEKLKAYRDFKKKGGLWEQIGLPGQQLYRMRRQVLDNQWKKTIEMINVGVEATGADKTIATSITNKFTQELESGGIDGYEPMTRQDGEYKLSYFTKEKGEPELGYQIFKSKYDRDRMFEQLEKDPLIVSGTLSKADRMDRQINEMLDGAPSNSFVGQIIEIMKDGNISVETQRAVLEAAASFAPSRALVKRLVGRKDTPGYIRDPFKAFNKSVVGTGRQLENLRHGSQIRAAMRDLQTEFAAMGSPEQLSPLMNELTSRTAFATNPTLPNWSNTIKTATFGWTLAFNISSPIVDTSSLALVTYPHLARKYGYRTAMREMTAATKAVMGSGYSTSIESLVTKDLTDAELSSPEIQTMLAEMGLKGRDMERTAAFPSIVNRDYSDPNLPADIREDKELADELLRLGHSQRFSTLRETVEVGESSKLSTVSAYMGVLMHSAERFKRDVTSRAMYKAELNKLRKEGTSITAEVRQKAAQEAVQDSLLLNGGSSALTKPGYTQSPTFSIIGMYKQYGSLIYYLQARLLRHMTFGESADVKRAAWHQWLLMSAMSAAFAGVRGMPLMGAAMAAYNIFADDEEDDAETALRKLIGTGATEGLIAQTLNMNIGPRIELTSMLVRDTQLPEGSSIWDQGIAMFGGPTFGSINRVARGVQLFQDGHTARGVESMMPTALSNVMKSTRFARQGALTLRGDPVVDEVSPSALLSQFLGFAPADYARSMDFSSRQKNFERTVNTRRNKLYERAYIARRTNDVAGYVSVMRDIIEFNKDHPNRAIDSRSLRQSITTRDRNTQNMRMGRLPGSGFEGRWEEEADSWGL